MDRSKQFKDFLFALETHNVTEAIRILTDYPELINMKGTDHFEQHVATPLIFACRYSKYYTHMDVGFICIALSTFKKIESIFFANLARQTQGTLICILGRTFE